MCGPPLCLADWVWERDTILLRSVQTTAAVSFGQITNKYVEWCALGCGERSGLDNIRPSNELLQGEFGLVGRGYLLVVVSVRLFLLCTWVHYCVCTCPEENHTRGGGKQTRGTASQKQTRQVRKHPEIMNLGGTSKVHGSGAKQTLGYLFHAGW